jgi:hypothetical protein
MTVSSWSLRAAHAMVSRRFRPCYQGSTPRPRDLSGIAAAQSVLRHVLPRYLRVASLCHIGGGVSHSSRMASTSSIGTPW